jgi:hypothetical protein
MTRQGEMSAGTRATTVRGPWLFQGILIAALVVAGVGFGYLLASRGRAPAAAPAAAESEDPAGDRRASAPSAAPSSGSEAARLRRRSAAAATPTPALRVASAGDDEPGAITPPPSADSELEMPIKSLPAVDGLLTQLKDRARARHDVTVDEIDPGVRAIHQLYGQLSPDEVLQKEGQFTREMAELSRQFRAERARSGNQPTTGGTE